MFSLLNPWSPGNCRSAVLPLHNFYLSYLWTDGLTALHQQPESRLHSWGISKLDSLHKQLKTQQWGMNWQQGLQREGYSLSNHHWSFLGNILFHSSLIPDYFPHPSDFAFHFSPPLWSSERPNLTNSFLQNFSTSVTVSIQSCHQLLCFRCLVSTCDLLFINPCSRNNVWHKFLSVDIQCSVSRERI